MQVNQRERERESARANVSKRKDVKIRECNRKVAGQNLREKKTNTFRHEDSHTNCGEEENNSERVPHEPEL